MAGRSVFVIFGATICVALSHVFPRRCILSGRLERRRLTLFLPNILTASEMETVGFDGRSEGQKTLGSRLAAGRVTDLAENTTREESWLSQQTYVPIITRTLRVVKTVGKHGRIRNTLLNLFKL